MHLRDRPGSTGRWTDRGRFFGLEIVVTVRMGCAVKHGRALLADCHLGMLGGLHSLLQALFETVLMVADERSLMEAVTAFKPDLVVVDLSLSREGETNIARCLIQRYPGLRLIVLSVYDEPAVAGQFLSAGVAGFVLKRATATDLVPAIEEVRRGGVYVSAAARPEHPEAGLPGVRFGTGRERSGPEAERSQ